MPKPDQRPREGKAKYNILEDRKMELCVKNGTFEMMSQDEMMEIDGGGFLSGAAAFLIVVLCQDLAQNKMRSSAS